MAGQPVRIAIMPPGVQLGLLTASGLVEPRVGWTQQATAAITQALTARLAGEQWSLFDLEALAPDKRRALTELLTLNRAVSRSILEHKLIGPDLPSKRGQLRWTLGPPARLIGAAAGADYAFFLVLRDTYASSAHIALQVAANLVIGYPLLGGSTYAHASLIDTRTGDIVWGALLLSYTLDLRRPENAGKLVQALLKDLPAAAVSDAAL
ncbi:MAG: hypothetical protein ACFB22_05295 [Rhodothalassiaceae bacterium]